MHYLILFVIVLIAGIVPAFGPPSWVFAVYFRHHYGLSAVIVIIITALATTLGRLFLAYITRRIKTHIPIRYRTNIDKTSKLLKARQRSLWAIIGLFILSPLPSAQLFEAAGLVEIPLLPIGLGFFVGRIISTSLYLTLAHLSIASFDSLWETGFSSSWMIFLEVISIAALFALLNFHRIVKNFKKFSATK